MALRRFKFNLMFILEVEHLDYRSMNKIRKKYSNDEGQGDVLPELMEAVHQRNLLNSLVNNRDELRDYVKRLFADSLNNLDCTVRDYFSFDDFLSNEKQLEPLLKTLEKHDQQYFENAIKNGEFNERLELFLDTFQIRLADITVTETD